MTTKLAIEKAKTNQLLSKILDIDWNATPVTPEEARILELLDENLNKEVNTYVNWLMSEEGKEAFINNANREVEIFDNIKEDIRQIYRETGNDVNEVIERIYNAGEAQGYNDIRQVRAYTDASKYALQHLKDYNFELIRNASNDFVDMIQEEIFVGMASDKHPFEIARQLLNSKFEVPLGMTLTPMQRARMIARTETARAQTTGTMQAYANYGVEEIELITARDGNVCTICLQNAYEFKKNDEIILENAGKEKVHNLDKATGLVPAHPNCRCRVTAHIRHGEELELQKNPKVIDNTPKNNSFDDLKTPKEIADYLGYGYNETNTHHVFNDKLNDMEIQIKKDIKFPNNASMNEILKGYDQLPAALKEKSKVINIGENNIINGECFVLKPDKDVFIYTPSINEGTDSVLQTMAHELGHSIDHKKGDSFNSYSRRGKNNFRAKLRADKEYNESLGLKKQDVSNYGATDIRESFAESVAYSIHKNPDALTNHPLPDGSHLTIREWRERYPNVTEYINELLK